MDGLNNIFFQLLEDIANPEAKNGKTEEEVLQQNLAKLNGACKAGEVILESAKIQADFAINSARFNVENTLVPTAFNKKQKALEAPKND